MIQVLGPNWPNTRALREALRDVPESGRFVFGQTNLDKLQQLHVMQTANVQCVPFSDDFDHVYSISVVPSDIWLGRKLNHTRGRDIALPRSRRWRNRDFWTKYIPSTAEWRIHIFNGKSIARGKKVFVGEGQELDDIVIRSRSRDYRMEHGPNPPEGMRKLAKDAVKACGLTYGAVDILVGADGKQYVLEVNCAPAMDNYTLNAYVKAIRQRFAN